MGVGKEWTAFLLTKALERRQVGICRVQIDHAIGDMQKISTLDDWLTGSTGDIVDVIMNASIVHPERQDTQPPLLRELLRNSGTLHTQGPS